MSSIRDRELRPEPMLETEFPTLHRTLKEGLAEGVAPAFSTAFWSVKDPARYRVLAMGQTRLDSPAPVTAETPFDLASVTKVYATATLCAHLIERGWASWDTPVRSILPQFVDSRVTLEHLLAHTGGLPAWHPLYEKLRAHFNAPLHQIAVRERQKRMRELVFSVGLENDPGAHAVYSDLSFLLLGFAIEEITGKSLDHAVQELIWKPMGIRNSSFRRVERSAADAADARFAATERCPWRGAVIQGQVHDDNCWAMGGYAGHAGAFGPAGDLMRFAALLYDGFLAPRILARAWTRVKPPVGPVGCPRTPGWDTPSGESPALSNAFSAQSVGHLGFTGTSLWIDPVKGLAIALLSNRVHPSRENAAIRLFRPRFHAALARDLGA